MSAIKGDLILNELRYSDKRYNRIKKNITHRLSARTLDYRLRELTKNKILEVQIIREKSPKKIFYSLSNKGKTILTLFECFNAFLEFEEREFDNHEIVDFFASKLKKNYDFNFLSVLNLLKQLHSKNQVIYSLKNKKPNQIISINEYEVNVKIEKGIDKVPLENLWSAWDNLMIDGFLYYKDYNKATYRSSFVLALFTQLPFIEIGDDKPFHIKIIKY